MAHSTKLNYFSDDVTVQMLAASGHALGSRHTIGEESDQGGSPAVEDRLPVSARHDNEYRGIKLTKKYLSG